MCEINLVKATNERTDTLDVELVLGQEEITSSLGSLSVTNEL